MNTGLVTDIDFLEREVVRREHFLYVYKKGSALLRTKVRDQIKAFAAKEGWEETAAEPMGSLEGQLIAPSWLGEMFVVCDAAKFKLDDLKRTLDGIAHGAFQNHLLLTVYEGSKVLEQAEWLQAKGVVGLIEEPTVTISNYRSVTRYLLKTSDLTGVQHFGEDDRFLARMKAFVQERGRSPFEISMEIDRMILTEVKNGILLDGHQVDERREREVLSERLNRFLDDRSTVSLHPLVRLVDASFVSRNESHLLLTRLFRASASIVAGRDQRYKRNREGNPAVLPYLAWGMMLLAGEHQLVNGNFVVTLEHLCQEYHLAAKDPSQWFVHKKNWQEIAVQLQPAEFDEPTALERAREELRSALAARIRELPDNVGLRWLLPLATNAQSKSSSIPENA